MTTPAPSISSRAPSRFMRSTNGGCAISCEKATAFTHDGRYAMKTRSLFAAGVGAGLTYFLDPGRGARRRARVRDTVTHSARVTRRAIGTVGRDMLHRTYGTAASLRSPFRHDHVDDPVVI